MGSLLMRVLLTEIIITILFWRLFVHRYRDIDNDIRMSCIQSLGIWILSYPSLFLQDLYLKYLGWTLNDKVSSFSLSLLYYHIYVRNSHWSCLRIEISEECWSEESFSIGIAKTLWNGWKRPHSWSFHSEIFQSNDRDGWWCWYVCSCMCYRACKATAKVFPLKIIFSTKASPQICWTAMS